MIRREVRVALGVYKILAELALLSIADFERGCIGLG